MCTLHIVYFVILAKQHDDFYALMDVKMADKYKK